MIAEHLQSHIKESVCLAVLSDVRPYTYKPLFNSYTQCQTVARPHFAPATHTVGLDYLWARASQLLLKLQFMVVLHLH